MVTNRDSTVSAEELVEGVSSTEAEARLEGEEVGTEEDKLVDGVDMVPRLVCGTILARREVTNTVA